MRKDGGGGLPVRLCVHAGRGGVCVCVGRGGREVGGWPETVREPRAAGKGFCVFFFASVLFQSLSLRPRRFVYAFLVHPSNSSAVTSSVPPAPPPAASPPATALSRKPPSLSPRSARKRSTAPASPNQPSRSASRWREEQDEQVTITTPRSYAAREKPCAERWSGVWAERERGGLRTDRQALGRAEERTVCVAFSPLSLSLSLPALPHHRRCR